SYPDFRPLGAEARRSLHGILPPWPLGQRLWLPDGAQGWPARVSFRRRYEPRVRERRLQGAYRPRRRAKRLQRNVRIQRDPRGEPDELVHFQRHPGQRPKLDPTLYFPNQLHRRLEGPVPFVQGWHLLERVPRAPPV